MRVFLLASLVVAATHPLCAQPARPNILWITCEDISPHLGCYGDRSATTPNIDRLAQQGVLYTKAFATIGVCAPARSTLITGMYPPSLGTHHMRCRGRLPAFVKTYSEHLRAAGYFCTNNAKTDYNFAHRKSAWDRSGRKAHWRQRADGQPFFAIFNFTVCHESKIRQPEKAYQRRTAKLAKRCDPKTVTVPPYHPDTPEVRQDWARYADMITLMDQQVGRVLKELKDDGLADDTIVFFYSDHGAGMPRSKRWLYDSGLHVPLILRFPTKYKGLAPGAPGTRTDRLVSFVDFGPTVLSLCGVDIPKHMQGRAFLGGAATAPRKFVYGFRDRMDERYDMIRCVRDGRFKYIRNFMPHLPYAQHIDYMYQMPTMKVWQEMYDAGTLRGAQKQFFQRKPIEELYDTEADPHEVHNLARDRRHVETLLVMRQELRQWMTEIVDLGFLPEGDLRTRFGERAPYEAVRADPKSYPLTDVLAAAQLASGTSSDGAARLATLLAHTDPAVRFWAATGMDIRETGDHPAALRRALQDASGDVRVAAATALVQADRTNAKALKTLVRAMGHANPWVRLRAINTLDRLDAGARAAHATLAQAKKDKNNYVRRVAAKALRDLDRSPPPRRKPLNLVFLLVDDMGWTDLGCYGSTFYETPNIDGLARAGMKFTNAYAACPVCSPTRASILAGKYPARMNTTDYFGGRRKGKLLPASYIPQLPHEEVTIAEAFRAAGYRTGFFGKWHLGKKPFTPESQGFDVNVGGFRGGMPPGGYFAPYKNPNLTDGPDGEFLTERLTDEALKFVAQSAGKPFLLYFSYYAVHTPLQTTAALEQKYAAKAKALPAPDRPRFGREGQRRCRYVQDHAVYAGMVQSVDDSVGRLLKKLEELGIADNTAIILMSDNGGLSTSEGLPTSNLPLRAGKGWLYEGGVREPLIVRWPGHTKPGSVCDAPVISTDFYPTMLEMAGLPARPEQHVDGQSFVRQLRGRPAPPRGPLFWHYPHYGNQGGRPGGAIRDGNYKLIEFFETDRIELYDLSTDIEERFELSDIHPTRVAKLRARLHAWRRSVDARMPAKNPDWRPRK